jgi:hypothetical protein
MLQLVISLWGWFLGAGLIGLFAITGWVLVAIALVRFIVVRITAAAKDFNSDVEKARKRREVNDK